MNPFNDKLGTYLSSQFNANLNKGFDSIWLDKNVPYFTGSDQTDNDKTNPFYQIPFVPGGLALANGSLPEFVKYSFQNGTMDYQYNLFGKYGHQLASAVNSQLPLGSSVISDSTAPGSGALGLAHVFPKQKGSYNDLQNSMANLLNFAAFGIPYVGASLCGYAPETSDQELCARYFQLAVVSPLAIINNGAQNLDFQPINFTEKYRQSVVQALTQRLSLLTQMRSEIKQVST